MQIIFNPRFPSTLVNHQSGHRAEFPPPLGGRRVRGFFIVRDANGQALYVYCEEDTRRLSI